MSDNFIISLPKELIQCKNLKILLLKNNKIESISTNFLEMLCSLDELDLRQNPIKFFETSDTIGLRLLIEKISSKLNIDIRNDDHIDEVFSFWKNKSLSFNFDNLKNCQLFSFPTHIYLERELIEKINEFLIDVSNRKAENYENKKFRFTSEVTEIFVKGSNLNALILGNFIYCLYDPDSLLNKFNIQEKYRTFSKQLIGAIVFKLFSIKNIKLIENFLNHLSRALSFNSNPLMELIYIFKNLIMIDSNNFFDSKFSDQDISMIIYKRNKMISKETQFNDQYLIYMNFSDQTIKSKEPSKLSVDLLLDEELNKTNLKIYLDFIIKDLIGDMKKEIFDNIFSNFKKSKTVLSLDKWKFLLKDCVGIDIKEQNMIENENFLIGGNIAFGLHSFFEQFTPYYINSELKHLINRETHLLSKFITYYKNIHTENKSKFFDFDQNDSNRITGLTDEFFWYILKDLGIIISN